MILFAGSAFAKKACSNRFVRQWNSNMNEQLETLIAEFKKTYDARTKDEVWRRQSLAFRQFWSERVLAKETGAIPDEECDVVIRILDRNGKGNTRDSEAVARAMGPQNVWRKLLNALHSNPKLALLVG